MNQEIVVEGFVARRDGRQLYHEGEIRNEAGDLLARGQGRFVVIDREKYRHAIRSADECTHSSQERESDIGSEERRMTATQGSNGNYSNDQWRVKVGLAEMLKGGVIMDVTNAEQARIAEDAGACAVMALERVPSDIRKEGGVARMASPKIIREIMNTVSIPVMAKVRIGHFAEAAVLEALEVDFIDESEVLTPADEENHVWKHDFKVPFVCGARNLGEALRRIAEGAAMIRTKGEAGSGNVVEAVRHMRTITGEMRRLTTLRGDELMHVAKELGAPLDLVREIAAHRKTARPEFFRRRNRDACRRRAGAPSGRRIGFRGIGNFQVERSGKARQGHRESHDALPGRQGRSRSIRGTGRSHEGPRHSSDRGERPAPDARLVVDSSGGISLSVHLWTSVFSVLNSEKLNTEDAEKSHSEH